MSALTVIVDDLGVLRALLVNYAVASASPALCRRIWGREIQDVRVNVACHALILNDGNWDRAKEDLRGKVGKKFILWADRVKGGAK